MQMGITEKHTADESWKNHRLSSMLALQQPQHCNGPCHVEDGSGVTLASGPPGQKRQQKGKEKDQGSSLFSESTSC